MRAKPAYSGAHRALSAVNSCETAPLLATHRRPLQRFAGHEVSIGGYRARKRDGNPDLKWLTDDQMLAMIPAIHAEFQSAYAPFCA